MNYCYYCYIEKVEGIEATDEGNTFIHVCEKHQRRFERQMQIIFEQSLNR